MEFSCKSERTLGCGILWQFQKPFQKFSKIFILFRISKKTFPLLSKIFNLSAMDYSGIASKYSPLIEDWPKIRKPLRKQTNFDYPSWIYIMMGYTTEHDPSKLKLLTLSFEWIWEYEIDDRCWVMIPTCQ